jgi:hypothetical protein
VIKQSATPTQKFPFFPLPLMVAEDSENFFQPLVGTTEYFSEKSATGMLSRSICTSNKENSSAVNICFYSISNTNSLSRQSYFLVIYL